MPNYNKVILIGHLTQDTELKFSKSGTALLRNTIAVNEYSNGEKKASFVEFTAFGKTAELVNEHLRKGSALLIDGRLNQQRWETDAGEKRSKLIVIANNVVFLGSGEKKESADVDDVDDDDLPY